MQVEVTDADREAAAQVKGFANWELWELCRPLDDDWRALYAKDFARHRHQACAPLLAEIARLRDAAGSLLESLLAGGLGSVRQIEALQEALGASHDQ